MCLTSCCFRKHTKNFDVSSKRCYWNASTLWCHIYMTLQIFSLAKCMTECIHTTTNRENIFCSKKHVLLRFLFFVWCWNAFYLPCFQSPFFWVMKAKAFFADNEISFEWGKKPENRWKRNSFKNCFGHFHINCMNSKPLEIKEKRLYFSFQ